MRKIYNFTSNCVVLNILARRESSLLVATLPPRKKTRKKNLVRKYKMCLKCLHQRLNIQCHILNASLRCSKLPVTPIDEDFRCCDGYLSLLNLYKEIKLDKDIGSPCHNYFITFNFKPDTSLNTIQKLISNVTRKKWMRNYYYNYEQRGESMSELGKGIHVHLIVKDLPKRMSEVCRECYNTVKNYVGNKKHVNIKLTKDEFVQDKIDYIKGIKWDSEKDLKIKFDKIFREKNNLELYYSDASEEKLSKENL